MHAATVFCAIISSATMASLVLILGRSVPSASRQDGSPAETARAAFVDAGTCIEAPTAAFRAPGLAGRATLCDDGHGVRTTVEIIGLPPGEEYTAGWLDYGILWIACRETACGQIGLSGDDPAASAQRIGAASVQPSGVLELNGELHDVRLQHGSRILVQILGERGRGGPYAQASFEVP